MKNIIKNKDNRYFRTSSFYAAAFLFAKGLELVNVEKIADPKRAQFVFRDAPDRELLLHSHDYAKENAPEVMVDARKLVIAIKTLKEKLYQDKF